MPCICGADLVVVARLRAAAVPRLSCGLSVGLIRDQLNGIDGHV